MSKLLIVESPAKAKTIALAEAAVLDRIADKLSYHFLDEKGA